MERITIERKIKHLQSAIYTLRLLNNDGVDLIAAIEQAESRLFELWKQAGWHCVSPIRNGSATESVFCAPIDRCQKFVSDWLKEHPEDKGNLIITPL